MKSTAILSIVACCVALGCPPASNAAIRITTEVQPTPGLPTHKTAILTAVSDNPAEPILGFDFAGHPDDNDPATGRGFFGPMNQVNPAGILTVFVNDFSNLFLLDPTVVQRDSHFLVRPPAIWVPPLSQDGQNILQAVWAYPDPQGLSVPLAQLVIPDTAGTRVFYRGTVLVGPSGAGVELNISGYVTVPEPMSAYLALFAAAVMVPFGRVR